MIPLRDNNPSRTVPVVNYLIIGINVLIWLAEVSLGRHLPDAIYAFGLVPDRFLEAVRNGHVSLPVLMPLFTSMFLHGGWMHLIGNMLFLQVFGDNIEDRLGHLRYIIFYLLAGVSAALTQVFINPGSDVPMVGASGAIAGVLGAYVLLFPRARVSTLIPIFFFFQIIEIPAFLFLGLWFLMQIISGVMALGIGGDAGGVAWWAHIGGFGAGTIMLAFLRKPSWR